MHRAWAAVLLAALAVTAASVGVVAAGGGPTPSTASVEHAPSTTDVTPAPSTTDVTPAANATADDDVGVTTNATYGTDQAVTLNVSGTQGRVYSVYVYDEAGERVGYQRLALSAEREPVQLGGLPAGSYRVVVVEADTGEQASATFGVGGPYEPGLVPELAVDEPADVVSVPVALPNGTDTATVELRGERGEYRVTATVVDADGDGVVTLDWNTFHAGRDEVSLSARGPDAVRDAERDYHLSVAVDGEGRDRGAILIDLEPLHSSTVDVYEAPPSGSPEASLERAAASSDVEADEWAFVVVHTQGVFGAVGDVHDLRSVGPDQVVLAIEPIDGGEPVRLTNADYVGVEEGRVVVGFAPGTDALDAGTQYDVTFRIAAAHPYRGGDETSSVNLNVVPAGSEPDATVVTVVDVEAPDRVATNGTANVTVTLANEGERTGTVAVSVTIGGRTAERAVVVPGNGRATVDVPFDASRVLAGDRQYVVEANGSRVTGTVVVGDENADDGPTLADRGGDRDQGSLPGFAAPGTVAALLATAGLAARRRRNRPKRE